MEQHIQSDMASNRTASTQPPQSPASYDQNDSGNGEVPSLTDEQLLSILGDEYTRRVLRAVTGEPKSGQEVMETADVSKATAYRRLERLQEAGLVESEMVISLDGHHHEEFYAVIDQADISLSEDGVDISLIPSDAPAAD